MRTVCFQPAEGTTAVVRKAAQGSMAEDGTFTMYTRKPGDGVYKGKYAVTFTVLKDPNFGGLMIPEKYAAIDDTPFTIEVTADRNDLLFQLDKQ